MTSTRIIMVDLSKNLNYETQLDIHYQYADRVIDIFIENIFFSMHNYNISEIFCPLHLNYLTLNITVITP